MSPRAPVTRRSQASGARSNFRKGEYDCSITSASWTRTRRCRSAVLARTMCGVSRRYWSPPVVVTLTPSGSLRCALRVDTGEHAPIALVDLVAVVGIVEEEGEVVEEAQRVIGSVRVDREEL